MIGGEGEEKEASGNQQNQPNELIQTPVPRRGHYQFEWLHWGQAAVLAAAQWLRERPPIFRRQSISIIPEIER